MLQVSSAETDSARLPDFLDQSILAIAKDIHLIIPSEGIGLQVVMFPIPKDEKNVVQDTTHSLEVRYSDEMGYEIHDGIKSAIKHVKLSFNSSDDAAEARGQIIGAQMQLSDVVFGVSAQVDDGTPAPRRSIAMINLWTSDNEVTSSTRMMPSDEHHSGNGSETQEASPLHRLSQKEKDNAEQGSSHKPKYCDLGQDQAGKDPESEVSFVDEICVPSNLNDRLRASQETGNEVVASEAFNERVDRAIGRVDMSPVKSNGSKLKEVTNEHPPHLPAGERQSTTSTPSLKLRRTSAAVASSLLDKHKRHEGAVGKPPLLTLLSTSPKAPESKKYPASEANRSINATKRSIRGPMARLAGSQATSLQPPSKNASDPSSSLKRKGAPSSKKDAEDTTDWDEGLRDDDTEEDHPKKKNKTGNKRATTKATNAKKKQGKKTAAATKKTTAKSRRTVTESQQTSVKETATSTRERRNVKSAQYVDHSDSASDPSPKESVESNNERAAADLSKKLELPRRSPTQEQTSGPGSAALDPAQHRTPPPHQTASNPAAKVKTAQASTGDVVKPSKKQGHMSPVHAVVIASSPAPSPATKQRSKVMAVASSLQDVQANLNGQDAAQDSHPMTKEAMDGRTTAPGISFDTKLSDLASPNDNKENMPRLSASPFGSKKQFVANVNGARSASPGKLLSKTPGGLTSARFPGQAKAGDAVAPSKPPGNDRLSTGSPHADAHKIQPPSAANKHKDIVNQPDRLAPGDLVRDDAVHVDDVVDAGMRLNEPANDPSSGLRRDGHPIMSQTVGIAGPVAEKGAPKLSDVEKAIRTPHRPSKPNKKNLPSLTTEKSPEKPSVVHFSATGPLNQGTSSIKAKKTSTSAIKAPDETLQHSRYKQLSAEHPASEDTPSRLPLTTTRHIANATSKELDEQSTTVDMDDVSIVEVTDIGPDPKVVPYHAKRSQGPIPVALDRLDKPKFEQSGRRDTPSESPEKSGAEYHTSMSSRTHVGNTIAGASADSASGMGRSANSRLSQTTSESSPIVREPTGPSAVDTRDRTREHMQDAEQNAPNASSAIEPFEHELDTSPAEIKDPGPQSISPSSSSETEEQEESEYEEPDSAEVSVNEQDTSVLTTNLKSQSRLVSPAPLLDDPEPIVRQHRDPGITRPISKRQHDSIGVYEILEERHPRAKMSIDTTAFRDQRPRDDDRPAKTSTGTKRVKLEAVNAEGNKSKDGRATVVESISLADLPRSTMKHSKAGIDEQEMTEATPPPRRKSVPTTRKSDRSHEKTRASMPSAPVSGRPLHDEDVGEAEQLSRFVPVRLQQPVATTPKPPEAMQLPTSTPIPFHEQIDTHMTDADEVDNAQASEAQLTKRRKITSFHSQDAADPTLIDGIDAPGYDFCNRPDARARVQHEMIVTREDSESPAPRYVNVTKAESKRWSNAAKQLGDLDTEFIGIYRVSESRCLRCSN